MLSYVLRDLCRNPRRTITAIVGVTLGVGLFSGVLFFVDASGASMTRRALAPLTLDVQAVVGSPLGRRLRFDEHIVAAGPLRAGQGATLTLTVVNATTEAVHEVVINDEPPAPLTYVHGSTTLNGERVADIAGRSPLAQGLARSGLNIGTVAPGAAITLIYLARSSGIVPTVSALRPQGTISSREDVTPLAANAAVLLTTEQLRARIRRIPGVAEVDGLSYVDLPAESLGMANAALQGPVRIFAFNLAYQRHYPSIRIVRGTLATGKALASAEAARALAAAPGDVLKLRIPGRPELLLLPISGITDLSGSDALFSSRKATKLEDFLYVPFTVVLTPETFAKTIIPGFQTASAAQGTILKSLPVSELDILLDRSRLRADPGSSLGQTKAIVREIGRIAPGQLFLIDNISNALEVARDDAVVGKRMFLFLGLPGMLLAAFLAVFGANVHADAQRREQATLRVHGADRAYLLRMLALKTTAFAGVGAILGASMGYLSVAIVLGHGALRDAPLADVASSAVVAVGAGVVTTGVALYTRGRKALLREISDERAELGAAIRPTWHQFGADAVLLLSAAVALVLDAVASHPSIVSVSTGRSASLPARLLYAPLAIWLGGALVGVRLLRTVTLRLAVPRGGFGRLVRGTLARSLRRRSWSVATAMLGTVLVVAFATNLAVFAGRYDAAKATDSRFSVGSDLRIVPSALSEQPHAADFAAALAVEGVAEVTPVVFRLENSVLIGPFDQDRTDLAAIDPAGFRRVAAVSDSDFVDMSAVEALAALRDNPHGLLVRASRADDLSIEAGDRVQVVLARGTKQQRVRSFRVVGLFEAFPGFPRGIDLVANLAFYRSTTGITSADFFLARASDRTDLARVASALRSGPGRDDPLRIETTATALNRDQSSLTAVNVRGLVDLSSFYALAMGAAVIAIFVFGLLMQRRREYLTLRANGWPTSRLLALILGESLFVATGGLAVGTVVGLAMAKVFVRVLRTLFLHEPPGTIAFDRLAVIGAVIVMSAVASALAATLVLRCLTPTAILREA